MKRLNVERFFQHQALYTHARTNVLIRYVISVAGVAVLTWLIGLVYPQHRVANISMVYLLLVLGLAVFIGSGPAILASVLAFLAFDWFFVQPIGHLTVSDPDEWLALFLFLVVAMITGQLAAGLRRRAEEARRRAHALSMLYELSIAILGDARLEHVLQVILERLRTALGLRYAAVLLLDATGRLELAAEEGGALSDAEARDRDVGALWSLEAGTATGRFAAPGAARIIRPLDAPAGSPAEQLLATYMLIEIGGQRLGVVVTFAGPGHTVQTAEGQRLLEAVVAQTGLAVGRVKLAQEEERARAAAASERMKSIFLASISHDLRTPLTSIKTAAAALQQEGSGLPEDPRHELAASIERETDRLNRLVGNLLEMSRLDAGGLPPTKTPEDLAEVIGTTVQRLEPLLAGHTLQVDMPDSLPLVPLDAAQMDRVLGNLIENAVKFSTPKSVIRIIVSAQGHGGHGSLGSVHVRVHNQGSPIPAGERERIFDKFYRLGTPPAGTQGTGLGLSIAKGIVEAHGGRIWVENDPDGVSFVLSLPLAQQVALPAGVPVSTGL